MFIYQMLPLPDYESTMGHAKVLIFGGFLDVSNQKTLRVSRAGHKFLDKVRDSEIWRQTKEGAA